jgi:hypothetical protein
LFIIRAALLCDGEVWTEGRPCCEAWTDELLPLGDVLIREPYRLDGV